MDLIPPMLHRCRWRTPVFFCLLEGFFSGLVPFLSWMLFSQGLRFWWQNRPFYAYRTDQFLGAGCSFLLQAIWRSSAHHFSIGFWSDWWYRPNTTITLAKPNSWGFSLMQSHTNQVSMEHTHLSFVLHNGRRRVIKALFLSDLRLCIPCSFCQRCCFSSEPERHPTIWKHHLLDAHVFAFAFFLNSLGNRVLNFDQVRIEKCRLLGCCHGWI